MRERRGWVRGCARELLPGGVLSGVECAAREEEAEEEEEEEEDEDNGVAGNVRDAEAEETDAAAAAGEGKSESEPPPPPPLLDKRLITTRARRLLFGDDGDAKCMSSLLEALASCLWLEWWLALWLR